MTAFGCQKPPYHDQGCGQCIAAIRANCRKLQAILSEQGSGHEISLAMLESIEATITQVERRERREAEKQER